jgi:hypothetical protein
MNKNYILTSLFLLPLALGGCDTVRNTFGLDHSSPDAWKTAEPSPGLILPPDFADRPKLPPPAPGAPNPHVIPDTIKAQKTVLGDAEPVDLSTTSTKGEREVLEKASENQEITPNIRSIVDEESQADSSVSGAVISKIQSWKKEAQRNLGLSNAEQNSPKKDDSDNRDAHQSPSEEMDNT